MKKHSVVADVEIIDALSDGTTLAKVNGMVVFVTGAVPGDVADIEITRAKANYREAKAVAIKKYSDYRTEPVCQHFGTCGGCKWQNVKYQQQLAFKQRWVVDALTRLAKVELPDVSPIIGSGQEYFYRNKMDFAFSHKQWLTTAELKSGIPFAPALGFHVPKAFDKILDINQCHLQAEPSTTIRLAIKNFTASNGYSYFDARQKEGLMRNLIIRTTTTGQVMVIVVFYYNDEEKIAALMDFLKSEFGNTISSLNYIVNTKANDTIYDQDVICTHGTPYITEEMEGLQFRVGPKSFYQTNPAQALSLYNVALSFADIQPNQVVYDLYTGTGTIACFLAKKAQKVVGIEYVPEAIDDAHINAQLNNITNTAFFAGDMKDVLTTDFVATHGRPDVIVTDPPRAGMHPDVVAKILEIAPAKVVYVSCNPSTQARDIALMATDYSVSKVQPVDMFPHTHHVENVVLLERRATPSL